MRKLRIALISMHTDPLGTRGQGDVGGMNIVVAHGARALVERGNHVEVFTRKVSAQLPDHEVIHGVHIHRLIAGDIAPRTKREQESLIEPFTKAMLPFLRGYQWDVVHSHHWFSGAALLESAHSFGIPHVQSFHSIAARAQGEWFLGEQPEGPMRVPTEALLAQQSDGVIAVSTAEAKTVIELGGSPGLTHVVTPGVDLNTFTPGAEDVLGVGEQPTILAAARLEPLKGLDLAVEALSLIDKTNRPRLAISGAPTAGFEGYDEELRDLAQERQVSENVWLMGPLTREELASAMGNAAVLIVPSYSETYGLVALEAAACATPVVAANVGGLPDAVSPDVNGLLIDGRDPQQWADTLMSVIGTDRGASMGAAGKQWAATHTWEQMVRGWEEVYLSV